MLGHTVQVRQHGLGVDSAQQGSHTVGFGTGVHEVQGGDLLTNLHRTVLGHALAEDGVNLIPLVIGILVMEIQQRVTLAVRYIVALQVILESLTFHVTQSLHLTLVMVLDKHLIGGEITVIDDSHQRLQIMHRHTGGHTLGSLAATVLIGSVNLIVTAITVINLLFMSLIEVQHLLFIAEADAAIVIEAIQLMGELRVVLVRHTLPGFLHVIGMHLHIQKPGLTVGIVTQQTERVARTGLYLGNSHADDITVIEDGLHQMLHTLVLAVIHHSGIADMRVITILGHLRRKQLATLLGILGMLDIHLRTFSGGTEPVIGDDRVGKLIALILRIADDSQLTLHIHLRLGHRLVTVEPVGLLRFLLNEVMDKLSITHPADEHLRIGGFAHTGLDKVVIMKDLLRLLLRVLPHGTLDLLVDIHISSLRFQLGHQEPVLAIIQMLAHSYGDHINGHILIAKATKEIGDLLTHEGYVTLLVELVLPDHIQLVKKRLSGIHMEALHHRIGGKDAAIEGSHMFGLLLLGIVRNSLDIPHMLLQGHGFFPGAAVNEAATLGMIAHLVALSLQIGHQTCRCLCLRVLHPYPRTGDAQHRVIILGVNKVDMDIRGVGIYLLDTVGLAVAVNGEILGDAVPLVVRHVILQIEVMALHAKELLILQNLGNDTFHGLIVHLLARCLQLIPAGSHLGNETGGIVTVVHGEDMVLGVRHSLHTAEIHQVIEEGELHRLRQDDSDLLQLFGGEHTLLIVLNGFHIQIPLTVFDTLGEVTQLVRLLGIVVLRHLLQIPNVKALVIHGPLDGAEEVIPRVRHHILAAYALNGKTLITQELEGCLFEEAGDHTEARAGTHQLAVTVILELRREADIIDTLLIQRSHTATLGGSDIVIINLLLDAVNSHLRGIQDKEHLRLVKGILPDDDIVHQQIAAARLHNLGVTLDLLGERFKDVPVAIVDGVTLLIVEHLAKTACGEVTGHPLHGSIGSLLPLRNKILHIREAVAGAPVKVTGFQEAHGHHMGKVLRAVIGGKEVLLHQILAQRHTLRQQFLSINSTVGQLLRSVLRGLAAHWVLLRVANGEIVGVVHHAVRELAAEVFGITGIQQLAFHLHGHILLEGRSVNPVLIQGGSHHRAGLILRQRLELLGDINAHLRITLLHLAEDEGGTLINIGIIRELHLVGFHLNGSLLLRLLALSGSLGFRCLGLALLLLGFVQGRDELTGGSQRLGAYLIPAGVNAVRLDIEVLSQELLQLIVDLLVGKLVILVADDDNDVIILIDGLTELVTVDAAVIHQQLLILRQLHIGGLLQHMSLGIDPILHIVKDHQQLTHTVVLILPVIKALSLEEAKLLFKKRPVIGGHGLQLLFAEELVKTTLVDDLRSGLTQLGTKQVPLLLIRGDKIERQARMPVQTGGLQLVPGIAVFAPARLVRIIHQPVNLRLCQASESHTGRNSGLHVFHTVGQQLHIDVVALQMMVAGGSQHHHQRCFLHGLQSGPCRMAGVNDIINDQRFLSLQNMVVVTLCEIQIRKGSAGVLLLEVIEAFVVGALQGLDNLQARLLRNLTAQT